MLHEALEKLDEALPMVRRDHGEKHPRVACIFRAYGQIYQKQDQSEKALKVCVTHSCSCVWVADTDTPSRFLRSLSSTVGALWATATGMWQQQCLTSLSSTYNKIST